jgi:dihydrolipoamide dehydrogenase
MYDLIVIGAGPGGYEAAAHAAKMGKKVALIEKAKVGGTCLNVGCIPAKTFLRSSKLYHEIQGAARYGVQVTGAAFDMPAVVERKNRVVGTLVKGVEGMLKRAGVTSIAGEAKLVARNAVQVGAERYEAANILVATGSRPATPPIPGLNSERVLNSDTIFGLTRAPQTAVIVGGGIIGLEFACFFSEIGAKVTVLEMLPQIAGPTDREIATRLQQALKRVGVEFQLSSKVLAVEGDSVKYQTADGAEARVEADCIVNATGRTPVVCGIGLDDVGVDFSRKGIRASDRGKTNLPGVWACGDVTGRRMLAHAATREGLVAVDNMFGGKSRIRYNAIPSVIYTHPEVASVGRTEEELQAEGIEYRKGSVPMAVAGRFLVENEGASGLVKVLVGARHGEILGIHALGDSSSEFIVAAAIMVETEMRVAEAAEIVFPHPTVSEALREAILAAR